MSVQALEQFYGTGRRKTAVARVFLRKKKGADAAFSVNGKNLETYFSAHVGARILAASPLEIARLSDAFDVLVTVKGSGIMAQAGAVAHGLARALATYDEENMRPQMRQAGLLTRDAREVERKKPGLRKARKRPQYSKR